MNIKSKLLMLSAIGEILYSDSITSPREVHYKKTNEKPKKNTIIRKGHSKFIIEGKEIWALNYGNALKKFAKGK